MLRRAYKHTNTALALRQAAQLIAKLVEPPMCVIQAIAKGFGCWRLELLDVVSSEASSGLPLESNSP